MYFNSRIFVFAFLPLFLLGWYLLGRLKDIRIRTLFLAGTSLLFYGWVNPVFVPLILASGLINFLFGKWLRREKGLFAAVTAIGVNVLGLFYCKYMGFFADIMGAVLNADFNFRALIVPAGISFFTFQQIAYLVDCRRGEALDYGFLEYIAHVSFFPTVLSGPITYHSELIPQILRRQTFGWDDFAPGAYAFSVGIFKKVILADTFGAAASAGFGISSELNILGGIFTALSYTLQIYFDFSGYSDMAMGAARMMGIKIPQNFDCPYAACDISAFWKRWHMSLTRFLTKYIYIPLGGSRRGLARTCINTLVVFFISGLWHGANYTFIIWGLMHGMAMVLHRILKPKLPKLLGFVLTFGFVTAAWVFFRADTVHQALEILRACVLGGGGLPADAVCAPYIASPIIAKLFKTGLLSACFWLGGGIFWSACLKNVTKITEKGVSTLRMAASACMLFWSVFSMSGVSVFLYSNF